MYVGFIAETTGSLFTFPFVLGIGFIAVGVIAFGLVKLGKLNEDLQKFLEMFSLVISVVGIILDLGSVLHYLPQDGGGPDSGSSGSSGYSSYADPGYTDSDTPSMSGSNPFASQSAGSIVPFGSYEGETLQWEIMKKSDGKALVCSVYNVEQMVFNETGTVSWETSSLRTWLNGGFIDKAFSSEEEKLIAESRISSLLYNGRYVETYDRVFALSRSELEDYYKSNAKRRAQTFSSAYSKSRTNQYWLRDSGSDDSSALIVFSDGRTPEKGTPVTNRRVNVRPAMWVVTD